MTAPARDRLPPPPAPGEGARVPLTDTERRGLRWVIRQIVRERIEQERAREDAA